MIQWVRNKLGRISTLIGGCSSFLDMIPQDISPVADHIKSLVGAKALAIISVGCFTISFMRHQYAAMQVTKLRQQVNNP